MKTTHRIQVPQPVQQIKPPLKARFAQFFKGKICESYIRYLMENNLRVELKQLIDEHKENPKKLDQIEYLIYKILSDMNDASITPAMRAVGSEARQYAMDLKGLKVQSR